jgi:hypothetical protein
MTDDRHAVNPIVHFPQCIILVFHLISRNATMGQNFEEDHDDRCNIAKPYMKGMESCPSRTGGVKPIAIGQLGSDQMPEMTFLYFKLFVFRLARIHLSDFYSAEF